MRGTVEIRTDSDHVQPGDTIAMIQNDSKMKGCSSRDMVRSTGSDEARNRIKVISDKDERPPGLAPGEFLFSPFRLRREQRETRGTKENDCHDETKTEQSGRVGRR